VTSDLAPTENEFITAKAKLDLKSAKTLSDRYALSRHVMPVMHNSATEMTENKPEDCPENHLESCIHARKIN
jgi:hypothetical protein